MYLCLRLVLVGLGTVLFPITTGFAASEESSSGLIGEYASITEGLPWQFRLVPGDKNGCEDADSEVSIYDFVSIKPIDQGSHGSSYLRFNLTAQSFQSVQAAISKWHGIQALAHPDTGLSYAWDYLLLQDQTIFHLHADCTFSEASFDTMVSNLASLTGSSDQYALVAIRCRCGGGCIW